MNDPITLTVEQALVAETTLHALLNERLPAKVQYRIARALRKLGSELKDFHQARVLLLKEHDLVDERGFVRQRSQDGQPTQWADALTEVDKQLAVLASETIELAGIHPIEIELLDGYDVSGVTFLRADWLFTECVGET